MKRKVALILSGGGAKGAFECGAEKYAREKKGYHWDVIAGVSVGALNAAMLAMEKYSRLFEIWSTITPEQVYTGGFNLVSLIKLFFGARSFYSNDPLYHLLCAELEVEKIRADLRVGAVSLMTGDYVQFKRDEPHLAEAILASTIMPIVWSPIDIAPDRMAMVDGGVRNVTPIGDVLDANPDEIVIINCGNQITDMLPSPPKNILQIGMRTLDLLLNELFVGDMLEFLRINALVQEASARGVTLHNPRNGNPLKYYACKIIEPEGPLGDTLDFSRDTLQRSLRAGWDRAREVLGD